jgi:tetratricopeptide (TPR) repeat protein
MAALFAFAASPTAFYGQMSTAACSGAPCPPARADGTAGLTPQGWLLHEQEGAAALTAGKPALALRAFQQAIQEKPSARQLWVGLGEAQQKLGQLEAAEDSYRKAHGLDPAMVTAVTGLADVLGQEKQLAASTSYWKQALLLQPGNVGIKFSLAAALLDSGENHGAASLFGELAERSSAAKDPNRGAVLLDLGTALARLGQYDEAARMYIQALSYRPVGDAARLSLIKALLTLLRYNDAQPYAREYLAAHPHDYDALYFSGIIDKELGNTDAAEQEFAAAVAADPKQFDGQLSLGAILRQHGKASEAIPHLEQAVKLKPDSKAAHFQLGRAYGAVGQGALAQQQDSILKQEEQQGAVQTQVIVLGNKAAAALEQHDIQLAVATYKQIVQIDPRNARVLYDLAMIYLGQGQSGEGRELLRQAYQADPKMPEVNAQLGYLDMVDGYSSAAEAELKSALEANPQSVEALGNLGVLYAREGQAEQAKHLLRLAVEVDPKYEQGHLNLGLVLASVGQLAEASRELEQAVALAPGNTRVTAALAAVRQRLVPAERAPGR